MARADITNELSETLRNLRIQKKIPATEIAARINKSPAFISRIENGSIKSIDTDDLYNILKILVRERNDEKIAEDIYRSLTIKYTSDEIKNQLWFTNFETVKCLIPIPFDMIDDINSRLSASDISRETLLYRINSNEAIPEDEANNNSIPVNQWYTSKHGDQTLRSIKIQISEKDLSAILNHVITSSAYIYIMAIVYYLIKIEQYKDTKTITEEDNFRIMNEVTDYLNSFKFYSTSEKNKLLRGSQSQEEYRQILTSFDVENYDLVIDILSGLKFASERNISDTNDKLRAFDKNMHWDLGFMLKIISLNYSDLKSISFTEKKNLISDIEKLISDYIDRSSDEQPIEYY